MLISPVSGSDARVRVLMKVSGTVVGRLLKLTSLATPQVKLDEKIAREQGFDSVAPLAAIAVALLDAGQIDLECLATQMLCGECLLPGFGMDGVPVIHVGICDGAGASLIEWRDCLAVVVSFFVFDLCKPA